MPFAYLHAIEDRSEDPRGDPPEPARDDYPEDDDYRPEEWAEQRERLYRSTEGEPDYVVPGGSIRGHAIDYFALMMEGARAQAAAVANPVTAAELRECLDVAEDVAAGGPRLFGVLPE